MSYLGDALVAEMVSANVAACADLLDYPVDS